jgi:hypothetical protein
MGWVMEFGSIIWAMNLGQWVGVSLGNELELSLGNGWI